MNKVRNNKWIVLLAAILINLCLGALNAWSIISTQIRVENPQWSITDVSLVFSIIILSFALTTIVAGWAQDRIGPRWIATIGGILLGFGIIMAGNSQSLQELYLWHGVVAGIGIGSAYVTPLATVLKWFPDKRGLMGGIVMGFFGAGAFVFGPIASYIIINTNSISTTLTILGFIYLIIVVVSAQLLNNPKVIMDNKNVVHEHNQNNFTPVKMLHHYGFYITFVIYTLGCVSGLTYLSNAHEVAQLFAGVTAIQAVSIVSMVSIFNAIGSPLFGSLSDYIGRKYALTVLYIIVAIALFLLPSSTSYISFLLVSSIIILCFGGLFGIFPTISADFYGTKSLGANYGLLFLAYGLAAFIGPRMAAGLADSELQNALLNNASPEVTAAAMAIGFTKAFYYAGVFAIIGAVLTLFINKPQNI